MATPTGSVILTQEALKIRGLRLCNDDCVTGCCYRCNGQVARFRHSQGVNAPHFEKSNGGAIATNFFEGRDKNIAVKKYPFHFPACFWLCSVADDFKVVRWQRVLAK